MTKEGFTYVDVRTPEEFASGRPAGSVNVPVSLEGPGGLVPNERFLSAMEAQFAKTASIIVGCKSGARSMRALKLLQEAGFMNLLEQRAGWDGARGTFGELTEPGWSRAELPVEKA